MRNGTHLNKYDEEKDEEDDTDINGNRSKNREEDENNDEESKSRKRGREKEWIDLQNQEKSDLPDPDSLPALLYQLTSVMRKCGGASARLRSLVLNSISEVSKCDVKEKRVK